MNLQNRLFTSILLIILFYFAVVNNYVLFLLLIIVLFNIASEFNNILKIIFYKKKITHFLIFTSLVLYFSFFCLFTFNIFLNGSSTKINMILLIILICIATDIGGYVFGKIFKGKKIGKISPNKTYSGSLGSYFLSFLVVFFFPVIEELNINNILFGFIISTISQFGDLFISKLKRLSNLKDTGKILPGHGGILDRIDGIIFALPLGYLLVYIL